MNSSHGKKVLPFLSACLLAPSNGAQPGLWSATGKTAPSSLSGPQKTRGQLSLALQSSLFTSASACDIHCAPLPAPPSQFALASAGRQTLAHTWVWEDLNPGPREARELRSHGAALAGASLTGEAQLLQPQRVPVDPARPPPEPLLPVVCSSSSSPQRCPGWTWGDASPRRPRVPWRGLWGHGWPAGSVCHTQLRSTGRPRPPARILEAT